VQEALEEQRDRALTTIATMLVKMEKKGIVAHRTEGRQFVYRALVSETDVQRSMVGELTELLCGGDVTALVSHLLTEQEIDDRELAKLKTLIAEHRTKERRRGR
jgi:predicted transcriptional regulator